MPDFLLELRSEEIPARMQAGARAELEKLFRRELVQQAFAIAKGGITVWSTPRRLALIARDLPDRTDTETIEIKGPKASAPEQAVAGFLRKHGGDREDLVERGGTLFLEKVEPALDMKDVLARAIPAIARDFAWPKSMRWGAASISTGSLRWVRPLSGIVAILGEDLVECRVDGVRSGYATHGHRFHCPGEITIGGAHDYAEKLRACHVIVDHEERAALIREGARKAAADAGLALIEDEGLVVENAGLTEWPVPLLGRFDETFLDVPPEVIQLTARTNQKYFVCEGEGLALANAFVCTANIEATDGGAAIVDGNRKVLAARLSDARFFWEQDRKTSLAEHAKKLERITFHEKLGTVADKVDRVAKLARWLVEEGIVKDTPLPLAGGVGGGPVTSDSDTPFPNPSRKRERDLADLAERAARLAKADLVTEMVGEFPELQGLMGGYYARAEGLPDEVADAIRDHYKPVGQGDEVPTAPVTVAVSLADKLDTLAAFFAIDAKPTGSKDPFALRRASLAVLSMILDNRVRCSLQGILCSAVAGLGKAHGDQVTIEGVVGADEADPDVQEVREQQRLIRSFRDQFPDALDPEWSPPVLPEDDFSSWSDISITGVVRSLIDFFADRLKVQQREAGVRHDLIDAVFALGNEDDLVRLLARVNALQAFIETEDGANLLAAYKRAANILRKEGWDSLEGEIASTGDEDPLENVDDPDMRAIYAAAAGKTKTLSYTPDPVERALMDALDSAEPAAAEAVAAEDFGSAMAALAGLRAPIDRFFEEVTVNADEENKRAHRLGLLARFRAAVHNVADFSRIEG